MDRHLSNLKHSILKMDCTSILFVEARTYLLVQTRKQDDVFSKHDKKPSFNSLWML